MKYIPMVEDYSLCDPSMLDNLTETQVNERNTLFNQVFGFYGGFA